MRAQRFAMTLTLALLAACGRIGFDDRAGDTDDARADGVGRCGVGASAPASVTLGGLVVDYTDFTGDYMTFAGASLTFVSDGAGSGSATSDGSGAYAFTLATGGRAQRVVVTLASAGYYTTTLYDDLLIDRSQSGAMSQIIGGGAMGSIYGDADVMQAASGGTLVLNATDCEGHPVAGVTYEVTPTPPAFEYNNTSGLPDKTVTSSQLPYGNAIAYNMPPTAVARIAVSRDGVPALVVEDVAVAAGDAMTVVSLHLP